MVIKLLICYRCSNVNNNIPEWILDYFSPCVTKVAQPCQFFYYYSNHIQVQGKYQLGFIILQVCVFDGDYKILLTYQWQFFLSV